MKLPLKTTTKILVKSLRRSLSIIELSNYIYMLDWYSCLLDDEYFSEGFDDWFINTVCVSSEKLRLEIEKNNDYDKQNINSSIFIKSVRDERTDISSRAIAFIRLVLEEAEDDLDKLINLPKGTYPYQKGIMNIKVNLLELAREYNNKIEADVD